jgi:hypothetical protein
MAIHTYCDEEVRKSETKSDSRLKRGLRVACRMMLNTILYPSTGRGETKTLMTDLPRMGSGVALITGTYFDPLNQNDTLAISSMCIIQVSSFVKVPVRKGGQDYKVYESILCWGIRLPTPSSIALIYRQPISPSHGSILAAHNPVFTSMCWR